MSLDINFITVQFYTTSDDKDDDTVVTCTVNKLTNGIPGPNLAAASGTCSLGITRTCVGAWGLMSRNASACSFS